MGTIYFDWKWFVILLASSLIYAYALLANVKMPGKNADEYSTAIVSNDAQTLQL
ncbi:MAG: hypothetical protein ACREPR_05525 [Brasilonema sp.]